MRSRKLRARTFNVGCAETKLLIRSAKATMTPTEMMTAPIMMRTSSTIPTAVMTESRENTRSSKAICTSAAVKVIGFFEPSR